MARTLEFHFDVAIPAGTAKATPLVTPCQIDPNVVDHISWLFPEGCQGTVGIQIGARSVPILPSSPSQFYVRSGDSSGINLDDMHDTGDWSVIGFNTGSFPHTVHVTFRAHRKEPSKSPDVLIIDGGSLVGIGVS